METVKQLGPARLAIMGAVMLGLLLFFVFISFRVTTPELKLLYSDLSGTDAATIAGRLEEAKIRYEISPDNTKIMVSEDEVGRARLLLAQDGLPNGGSMGYELFDQQTSFGTTNFVQNVNQVRALEGELARTISSMEQIRSARVHLVLPQRELFSRESRPSSASVFLGIRPGNRVDNQQILAIQSLVASAVPELKPDNVAVIDQAGTLLAQGVGEGDDLSAMKTEDMRLSYERRMIRQIEELVSRIVGYGKVRATVNADLNFDRISTNEEIYDPSSAVIRSSQLTEESNVEREPPPEDVTVGNNLPGATGGLLDDQTPSAENNRLEEVTNYEISKTVRNMVREVGEVKRLSVAVLVDGRYTETITEEGEIQRTYEPRTNEELEQIRALVRSAVGYDEERGDTIEIVNMQFAEVEVDDELLAEDMLFGFEKSKLIDAAEIIAVAIMIVLVVLLFLQPMIARLLATESGSEIDEALETDLLTARQANPALTGPSGEDYGGGYDNGLEDEEMIDMQRVEGQVKASSLKKVEDIIESYPSETVSVIRSWMNQES